MTAAALFVLLALAPPDTLQSARPQLPAKLRPAEEVLADYVKAIGGAEAWSKHKSVRMKRKMEAKGMQIGGTEERVSTAAGKSLITMSIGGMGEFRQGTDGKAYWSQDPINGLRLLEGVELEEARVDHAWNGEVHLAKLYEKVRSVPPPEAVPAGRKFECVELVLKGAKPAVSCFDAETHLRVYQKGTRSSPQGELPYRVTVSDWRSVEGMRIPYSEEMAVGPMTMLAEVIEVKLNEKVAPKLFALPKAAKPSGKAAAK